VTAGTPATGRRRRSGWRLTGLLLLGALVLTAVVLGVEAYLAANREYLPNEPGYLVEATVEPSGAGAEAETGAPLELVILGDSTVAGVGSPTRDESLAVLVAQRVADAEGRPVHVIGYGVSGARTADVTSEQIPRVLDEGVDVVAVVVGSNDVTHATSPGAMEDRTVAMLRAARERAEAPVVLGGIPRFQTVPALLQPLRTVVDTYAAPLRNAQRQAVEIVEDRVSFVDIAAEASPRFVGVPDAMSSDGFHPGPVGYGFWADALAPAVAAAVPLP